MRNGVERVGRREGMAGESGRDGEEDMREG